MTDQTIQIHKSEEWRRVEAPCKFCVLQMVALAMNVDFLVAMPWEFEF